jgi:hypothetical protein
MKRIKDTITKFADWFKREYAFMYEDDFPESIKENTIYIIGDEMSPWLLAFKCPCGCTQIIQLNLLKDADPRWKFKITVRKKISISPSIWRTTGCKSHFILRNSKVEWASRRKHF